MNSFISVTGSASSLIDTTQVMIPDLNELVGNGQNTVNAMQGAVTSGTASADTVSDMVSYSLDMIGTTLDQVSSMIQNDLSNLEGKEGSVTNGLAGAQAIMPYLKQMFGSTTSSIVVYDGVDAQVIEIQTQLDQISTDLEAVSTNAGAGSDAVKALEQQILGEISTCKTKINALGDTYTYSIKPQLRSTINSMQGSLNSAQAILSGVDGDLSGVTDVLEEYGDTLSSGMEGLVSSRDMAVDMKEKLDQIRTDITTLTGDEQYKELLDVLKTDPELLGSFAVDFLVSPPCRAQSSSPKGPIARAHRTESGILHVPSAVFQELHNFIFLSLCTLRIDKSFRNMYNKARNQRSTAEAQERANPADLKQKGARPMVDMEPAQQGQAVGIR